ncbi:MAG: toll/interleukin-1 receptor domain-containing protein [Armatimonadetes bacterium]|nr:toll/interleukin-1 receptor domain-containing protein [Armatimonadota bacterium]
MTAPAPPAPRVFISYSHDSPEHAARVLALADSLVDAQVDVILDQYDPHPGLAWPLWMQTHLDGADFTLMVCTEAYQRRVMRQEAAGKGLGVQWEGSLIYNRIYKNPSQGSKYIPVLFREDDAQFIPEPVWGHTRYVIRDFDFSDPQYEALYRHLTDQPSTPKPQLGTRKVLPPRPRGPFPTAPPPSASTAAGGLWNVPYARNPFFTGREDALAQLEQALAPARPVALTQPVGVTGLGGLGKTQTAVEYAYRHRDQYRHVLWVRAETETGLREGYVEIARLLKLQEAQEADQSLAVNAVRNWLDGQEGWLLVLDNADDVGVIRPFLPQQSKGHVLLTSRAAATGAIKPVRLDKLPPEQGALLLVRRARLVPEDAELNAADPADRAASLDIAREVDGLPLALDQAGAFLEETQSSPAEYLDLYRKQETRLLAEYGEQERDHDSVSRTFSLAFTKMGYGPAADLVRACAFLAPDAIPEEAFTGAGEEWGERLAAAASDGLVWRKTAGEACRYSLLSRDADAGTLSIHRLVQSVLRDTLTADERRAWAERAVRAVNRAFPAPEFVNWPQCERLLPHTLACAGWIEAEGFAFAEAARLLNQAGYYLDDRAQYAQAAPLYRRALAIFEQALGPEHPDTAASLNNLAVLYKSQGRLDEAAPLYRRALAIDKEALGENHPGYATDLNNLAGLYQAQGRLDEAAPLYRRALDILEKALGPEHPNTKICRANYEGLRREWRGAGG